MPLTTGASIFPEPRSFFWRPIDGERHAAEIRDRNLPPDELIGTLCGQQLNQAPVTDLKWLGPPALPAGPPPRRASGCGHELPSRRDTRYVETLARAAGDG